MARLRSHLGNRHYFPRVIGLLICLIFLGSKLSFADDQTQVMLALNTSGHNGHVTKVIVDRHRSQLISVSHDKTIRFWDLATYSPIRVLRPPLGRGWVGELYSAAISPDGQWLAVSGFTAPEGTNDHSILLISLPEGILVRRLHGHTLPVQDISFSPDGRWLAAAGTDGVLRLWETVNWNLAMSLPGHLARIDSIAWHPDSTRLATGAWDKTFRIWSIANGTSLPMVGHGGRNVYCVAWSPDGQSLATGGGDNWVKLWDSNGVLRANLISAPESIETVAFSPEGTRLAYGYGGKQTNPLAAGMIRLSDRQLVAQYFGHFDTVKCSVFSPDGRYVILGDSDDQICVWEADTSRLAKRLRSEGMPIYGAGFSVDSRTIGWGYTHLPGSSIHATNPLQRSFNFEQLQFGPTPDFSYVRAQARWGNLQIARSSFQRATVSQFGSIVSSYYDPTIVIRSRTLLPGNRAAIGCDQSVLVFDALTGRSIYRLPGHLDAVWAVTPSPDQRHLLTGSDDETLQIWNLERYEHTLSLFVGGDEWVAWTPQGYYAASPGAENMVGWHAQRSFDEMATYYPASRFHSRFYRPEIIRRVLAFGGPMQALKELDRISGTQTSLVDIQHSLPPKAKVEMGPLEEISADGAVVPVNTTALPAEGDSIHSMRLLIDGRPGPEFHDRKQLVAAPAPESTASVPTTHVSWKVALPPGKHQLAVKAESGRSIGISEPVSVEIAPERAAMPRMFVLAIGVSMNQRMDLRRPYVAADAQSLVATLTRQPIKDFREVQVRLLTDLQVTRTNFEEGLQWLKQSMTPDDVAVIYFGGYALRDTESAIYLQHFESRPGDPAAGVSDSVLRNHLQQTAGKLLLLLDVLTRDEAPPTAAPVAIPGPTPGTLPTNERRSIQDVIRELASEDFGVAVLANVSTHEPAATATSSGHNPFAQSIIDGLSGKADTNVNATIDIRELIQFVPADVKQRTNSDQSVTAARPALLPSFAIGRRP